MKDRIDTKAKNVRFLFLDVDGVLTDGGITLSGGEEFKTFNVKDGAAVKWAQRNGIEVGIITGRTSSVVEKRAEELNIERIYQGALDKAKIFDKAQEELDVHPKNIGYIGDDLLDIPVLKRVGLPCCVCDAVSEVKQESLYVTETKGGRGAVREVIEKILKAQGKWDDLIREYQER